MKADRYGAAAPGDGIAVPRTGRTRAESRSWASARSRPGVLDSSGKHLATHPRAYGQASTSSEDPSMQLAPLCDKPASWPNSRVRDALPDPLRQWLDRQDRQTRNEALQTLKRVDRESGGGRTRSRRCFPSSNRPAGRTAPVSHCSRPGSPRAWRVSNATMTGRIRVNTTSRSPRTSACREAGDGHEDGRRALREGPQAVHLQGEHRRVRRLGHAPPGRRRPPPARHGTGQQGTREARQAPAPRPVPRRQGSRRLRLHERRASRRLHARTSS